MKKLFALLVVTALCAMTIPSLQVQGQKNGNATSRIEAASVPGELLIQFRVGATDEDKDRALGRIGGEALENIRTQAAHNDGRGDLVLARFQPDVPQAAAIRRMQDDPAVEFAEPNFIYTHQAVSNDPYYTNGSLWGMYGDATTPANQYGSQAGEAWAAGHTGSSSVYVGVIDEGIQFTHPDLDANVWNNPFDPADGVDNDGNGYVDDIHGWDFDGNNNTIYDGGTQGRVDDHGTHVTGTIGAEGGNGIGVAGVNWSVTYISGKFLGRRGGTTANAIKAVDYFTDLKTRHGLNIVATNNSWGGGGFSQGLLDAINRGGNAGILFIAAAGNSGTNNDTTASYPSNYQCTANGTYDCVIAVAAITSTGGLASYSQYGATTVDIGAPGSGVYSTTAFNLYSSFSGTSMATPHVTGGAALYASTHPGASAAQIRTAIMSSAVPTASLSGRCVTGGRLNVSGF
jgi:subtilisin family serine protease